jgi:Tol biopolymer transport system component
VLGNARGTPDLRIRPLTSQPGWEAFPGLSPDGRAAAFCWTDDLDRPRQIYVKRLDTDAVTKLTESESAGNIGPLAWSPDGNEIAFKRLEVRLGAIYIIGKDGGTPRKAVDLNNGDLSSMIDWSPDGTQLAFSDAAPGGGNLAIYLFNLKSGEKRKLTSPPPEDWGDWSPALSPDGQTIAFKRVTTYWVDDIYLVPVAGGKVRRVTADRRGIWGHDWMPDGESLVLACQRRGSVFGLWRVPVGPRGQGQSLAGGGIDAITPACARRANRMVWVNHLEDLNIYRVATDGAGTPTRLVASTMRDQSPDYSPDGRMAFVSDRSGSAEVWIARADGSHQMRVTSFNGPAVNNPRWSPDGRRLAFDSRPLGHPTIYIADCESIDKPCGEPRLRTNGNGVEVLSSWSADGQFLYFASDRTGRWEVWKEPAASGDSIQLTRQGGYFAFESRDARWLYFSKPEGIGKNSIWRRPGPKAVAESEGSEEELLDLTYQIANESWTVAPEEIYFVDRASDFRSATIRALNLKTRQVRPVLALPDLLPERAVSELSVSPDARWLLFSRLDRSGSNVMVADIR